MADHLLHPKVAAEAYYQACRINDVLYLSRLRNRIWWLFAPRRVRTEVDLFCFEAGQLPGWNSLMMRPSRLDEVAK